MANRHGLGRGLGALLLRLVRDRRPRVPPIELPIASISPNPNQPRKDFDDKALRDLSDSLRAVGAPPAAGRAAHGRGLSAHRGGAPLARGEACGNRESSGDRPRGHRLGEPGAGARREPPPRGPEPDGGGGGLPAAAGRVRMDAGGAGSARRARPEHDRQLPPAAQAARAWSRRTCAPAGSRWDMPGRCSRCPARPSSSGCARRSSRTRGRCARPRRTCSAAGRSRRGGRRGGRPRSARSRTRCARRWPRGCASSATSGAGASRWPTPRARSWIASSS